MPDHIGYLLLISFIFIGIAILMINSDEGVKVTDLDLDDVASQSPLATRELIQLRAELAELRAYKEATSRSNLSDIGFRADGEANFYTLSRVGGDWVMRIQFNGTLLPHEQETMLSKMLSPHPYFLSEAQSPLAERELVQLRAEPRAYKKAYIKGWNDCVNRMRLDALSYYFTDPNSEKGGEA